jgi:hypothetical protein
MTLIDHAAPSRPAGYKEELVAAGSHIIDKHGDLVGLNFQEDVYHSLRAKYSPGAGAQYVYGHTPDTAQPPPAPPAGAGTALKGLLKLIGITSTPTCKCNARARTMDDKGLQWCRDNEELIAGEKGWLAEEATKRSLPYVPFAGKKLLKLAIYRGSKYPDARP